MSITETSRKAGAAAKAYLDMRRFTVVEQNFRRPCATIDIIATKGDVAYLVEVKYQRSDQSGGQDYLTDRQLRQMRDAAETWAAEYKWLGECRLSVVEVVGKDFTILHFIESVG